jgi:hypothetical protein
MKTTTIASLLAMIGLLACAAGDDAKSGAPRSKDTTGGDDTGSPSSEEGSDPAKDPTNPDAPRAPLAKGISVVEIAFFQGVKVDVVKNGAWLATRNAPVVAGRPALVRVYVAPESGFGGGAVTAELRVESASKKFPLVRETKAITKASTDEDTRSTFNLEVPAEYLTTDATFQVALTSPDGDQVAGSSNARFPRDGSQQRLNAKASGKVKVVVVPVKYDADGSGRVPDVGAAQIELYKKTMMSRYPATDVEITVRAPWSWATPISRNGSGFSQVLSAITRLRQQDGAAKDVYYYGALAPAASFGSFCGGGCVTGLSTVVDSPQVSSMRASVGIGFTGYDSANTMAHEVGHAHGRNHAPCGGAQGTDPDFPYSDGTIGVWGYDILAKTLISPTRGHDMMGYCPNEWVSDYTFSGLFDRVSAVTQLVGGAAGGSGSGQSQMNEASVRLAVADENGELTWSTEPFTAEALAGGEAREVSFTGPSGIELGRRTARFFKFDHLPGGIVVVPDFGQAASWSHVKVQGFTRALDR